MQYNIAPSTGFFMVFPFPVRDRLVLQHRKGMEYTRMKNHFWTRLRCQAGIFLIGGLLYNLIEIIWRGYTHWSMFLVGGLCFQLIGCIHTALRRWGLFLRCVLCSLAVTAVEFASGCLFNLKLQMNVWDYSGFPLNILGQVCLLYTILWGLLSIVAIPVYWYAYTFLETGRFHRTAAEETAQ